MEPDASPILKSCKCAISASSSISISSRRVVTRWMDLLRFSFHISTSHIDTRFFIPTFSVAIE